MTKSIEQLVLTYLSNHVITNKVLILHALSIIPMTVAGAVYMINNPTLFVLWIAFSILSLAFAGAIRFTQKKYQSYLLFALHYLFVMVLQIQFCVLLLFHASTITATYIGIYFGLVIRGTIHGIYRNYDLSKMIKCNDLYYYDQIEENLIQDVQRYTSIKPYIFGLILQVVQLIAYILVLFVSPTLWKACAFLTIPFHEAYLQHIPQSFFKASLLKRSHT